VTNTVAYHDGTDFITAVKVLMIQGLGANDIKLFNKVIYCHSMVIPSFCVLKLHYLGNYLEVGVKYDGKQLDNIGPWWQT